MYKGFYLKKYYQNKGDSELVEIPQEIKDKLNSFIYELKIRNLNILEVFLFGSYAQGKQTKYSDIDLAIVSDDFVGDRYFDLDKIRPARFAVDTDISVLPYRPEDFNPDDLFVKEILKYGIRIV